MYNAAAITTITTKTLIEASIIRIFLPVRRGGGGKGNRGWKKKKNKEREKEKNERKYRDQAKDKMGWATQM